MDFKKTTRQHAERKYIQMLDGSTPPPYESDAEIDASRTYSSKRDRYYNRLSQERSEFNSALSKVQSAEGARLRKEEADIEAKARSRYKLFKMLKTIAFLLPLLLVVLTGINIFSRDYHYVSSIDFESIWIFGMFASVILAIILIVSLYKKEIYYSRTNVKNGVKFSALAIIVTVVTILVGILFLSAKPSVSSKDDFVFMKGDRGCVLIEYKGDAEIVILPEKYEGEAYQIHYEAFSCDNVKSMTKLVIPATATDRCDFRNCTSLKDVEAPLYIYQAGLLPKTIESLSINDGRGANDIGLYPREEEIEYPSLESITIGSGVTKIGGSGFYGCPSLTEINFNATAMNDSGSYSNNFPSAGQNGEGINVTIGKNVTKIPARLFSSNYYYENSSSSPKITSVVFEEGSACESIGEYAFYNCSSLENITIPDSVTSLGEAAFYGCTSLKSITIPNGITTIESSAFKNCSSLTSVIIPDSVTSIGDSAFSGCPIETATIPTKAISSISKSNLQTLVINGGDSIENYAFRDCDSLTSVTIPDSVTSIGSTAFSGCTSLTSVTIPDSVTSIGYSAFSGCDSLTSVTIGNGVTSIGESAFYDCTLLAEINFNATAMDDLSSYNYVFYNSGNNGDGIKVTIGKNVTKIPAYLFYPYSNYSVLPKITSVVFEEGSVCESIGNSAFGDSYWLKSVNISDIASWCCISFVNTYSNPLSYAENLYLNGTLVTELVIPNTVTEIKDYAFGGCTSLTSVTIPDSVTSIGDYAFEDCTSLTSVNISDIASWCSISFSNTYSNPLYYAENLYLNGTLVTELVIPNTVTEIKDCAFRGCTSLTSVIIPNSITSIGEDAFYGCYKLESITIPNSVTEIGSYAFRCCYKLLEVYNLSSLDITVGSQNNGYVGYYTKVVHTSLDEPSILETTSDGYVFAYVSDSEIYLMSYVGNEKELTLPDGYKGNNYEIYEYAFYNRDDITKVTIPDSVTSIGDYAFWYCTSLESVTIGNGVTSIGYSAFYNCTSLESIIIPDSVALIEYYAFRDCDSLTIYCEAESEPSGWNSSWNYSNRPVVWGYTGE